MNIIIEIVIEILAMNQFFGLEHTHTNTHTQIDWNRMLKNICLEFYRFFLGVGEKGVIFAIILHR